MLPQINTFFRILPPININQKAHYLKNQLKRGSAQAITLLIFLAKKLLELAKYIFLLAYQLFMFAKNTNRFTENAKPKTPGTFTIQCESSQSLSPRLRAFGREVLFPCELSSKESAMLHTINIHFNKTNIPKLNRLIPKFNLSQVKECYLNYVYVTSYNEYNAQNLEELRGFSKIISSFKNLKKLHLKCFSESGSIFPLLISELIKRGHKLDILEIDLTSPELKYFSATKEKETIQAIKKALNTASTPFIKKLILYGATGNTLTALMQNDALKTISQIPSLSFSIKPDYCNVFYAHNIRCYDRATTQIGLPLSQFFEKIGSDILTEINLNYQIIGNEGTCKLAKFISSSKTLRNLFLENCDIDDDKMLQLANVLQNNKSIQILNLKKNQIKKAGMNALAKLLLRNNTLHTLNLSATKQNEDTMHDFIESLCSNKSLKNLKLSLTHVGSDFAQSIAKVFKANNSLTHLKMNIQSIQFKDYLTLRANSVLNKSPSILRICVKNSNYTYNRALRRIEKEVTEKLQHASNISTIMELSPLITSMFVHPYSEKEWSSKLSKYVSNILDKTIKDIHTKYIIKNYLVAQLAPSPDACKDKDEIKKIALCKMKYLCCDRLTQIMNEVSCNGKAISKSYRALCLKLMTNYFSNLIVNNALSNSLKDKVWGTNDERNAAKKEATRLIDLLKTATE